MRSAQEPVFNPYPRPVEGRVVPVPSAEMKAPLPFNRPEPRIVRMFPLFDEPRRPAMPPNGRRIRFPDSSESEEVEENRIPIITEITKIIPIRIEREESKINPMPLIPLSSKPELKNDVDNKLEKLPERPFPIPINAILDMIFRGIRPLMGNRPHVPVPIDIKIERIENKPFDGLPIIKKLEILEKEPMGESQDVEDREESSEAPEQNPLELDDAKKSQESEDPEKDIVEAKVERVEIFDKEEENTHPIPIPADAQDAQIFKLEGETQTEAKEPISFENRAFLPNGQGRGARVFPIPQQMREAEIFSVSDARSNKNMDIKVESSFAVVDDKNKAQEGRQARVMTFSEGGINVFPIPEGRAMNPLAVQTTPQLQSQTFTVNDARSVQLYPVEASREETEAQPQAEAANAEESRPHCEYSTTATTSNTG